MESTLLDAPVRAEPLNGEALYEIINGQRVEKPMSALSSVVGSDFGLAIHDYARPKRLGRSVFEVLIGPDKQHQRRPDAAYVSYERWPKDRPIPNSDPWPVVPNIVVEVVSPTNVGENVLEKVFEYLEAGVELVWVVYPQQGQVYVYQSPTDVRGLTREHDLDGGTVLPDFRVPLADLLPPTAKTEPK